MRARLAAFASCAAVLLGLTAAIASAQTAAAPTTTTTKKTGPGSVLDVSAKPVTELRTDEPAAQPDPGDVPEAATPDATRPAPVQDRRIASGIGSAQLQSPRAKRREAKAACHAPSLPVSSMLGLPGTIGDDRTSSWASC